MADIMATERLTAGHGTLTADRCGKGRDLVVLHSLLADRHAFDPVLPAFAAKHRVTLFNLPGFHGSQPDRIRPLQASLGRFSRRLSPLTASPHRRRSELQHRF